MGKHSGIPASETPIDPRTFDELTPAEQAKNIEKAVDFDTQEAMIKRGTSTTPPAV